MTEENIYQGLTVVCDGKPLNTSEIINVLPAINDYHDGKISHGNLITKINDIICKDDGEDEDIL